MVEMKNARDAIDAESGIAALRDRIDETDARMLELLDRRVGLARSIGTLKEELVIPVHDGERERDVIEFVRSFRGLHAPGEDFEPVFREVIRACRAAQARLPQAAASRLFDKACVVGGRGGMGSLLVRSLRGSGIETTIVEEPWTDDDPAVMESCDLVILAVPMGRMRLAVERACGLMRRFSLAVDISSLMTGSVELLREHCHGSFAACHPMFGPATESLEGHTVFICGSGGDAGLICRFESLLESWGLSLVRMSAVEHDRLMAIALLLRQAVVLATRLAMSRMGFGLDREEGRLGRGFEMLRSLIRLQLSENPALIEDIASMNGNTPEALAALSDGVNEVLEAFIRPGERIRFLLDKARAAGI